MEDPDVDVVVEDEPDFPDQAQQHPDILQNQNPNVLGQYFSLGVEFIQSYGWFIVVGILAALYVWHKLQPYLDERRRKQKRDSEYQYDGEVALRRGEAMADARRRMQEKLDAEAARHAEKQKLKEEQKRKEKIEDWDRHQEGKGYRSKLYKPQEEEPSSSAKSGNKPKRPQYRSSDYNPLLGGSGGAGYRPQRRGFSGGGGG